MSSCNDVEVFVLDEVPTDQVSTPTGLELVPIGWDDEDTITMSRDELKSLLEGERTQLRASCKITERRGSRPALRLDFIESAKATR